MSKTPLKKDTANNLALPTALPSEEGKLLFIEMPVDEMSAKITVLPPASENDKFVTVQDLTEALEWHNVTYGIDQKALNEVTQKIIEYGRTKNLTDMISVDIAFGQPPIPGTDAEVEYFYKTDDEPSWEEGLPEMEDGRVDFKAGRKMDNVVRGSLLIRKTPATAGTPGRTVTGRPIYPPPGKDISLSVGHGVITYPESPNDFYADENGRVVIKEGRITVQPVHEVHGDVDMSIGHIIFFGTVIIYGDVKDGFKIHAGADLVVRGAIEGADVQVEGNLTVYGGISGNDKAHIVCKGDATIRNIQNATVEVDGNLTVKQSIMHSKVTCDHYIRVMDPKGMIAGGQVIARREVSAAIMGTHFATPTEIVVGHQVELREQILRIEVRMKELEKSLDKTNKAIAHLKKLYELGGDHLPPDKKELYKWLSRALIKITSETKTLALRKVELELKQKEFMAEKPVPRVNCSYKIYPGVKVTINKAYTAFVEEQKYCTLIEREGEVSVSALSSSRAKTKKDQ